MIKYIKVLVLLMLFSNCRYEDGPLISLKTVETRIVGKYAVESATKNGIDQMSKVDSLKVISLNFSLNIADYTFDSYSFGATVLDSSYHASFWALNNNKDKIEIENLGCYGTPPAPFGPLPGFIPGSCNPAPEWEIIKLTERKMWLKTTFQGDEYEVHLKE